MAASRTDFTIGVKQQPILNSIDKLKNLKVRLTNLKEEKPDTEGGGSVVSEVEQMGQLYKDINVSMLNLITNTIDYLSNVVKSLSDADKNASGQMIK